MGTKDRTYGATDTDKDVEQDTEAHDWRRTYPLPPNVEGGGSQPSDLVRDDGDTEGHYQLRRRPGEGGE